MKPIEPRKLSHAVEAELVAAIQRGDYPPGSQLPGERVLMDRMKVGRPAIREAMQSLQKMGLVEINHGARARVLTPAPQAIIGQMTEAMVQMINMSPESLGHLREARLFLEIGLVRLAAKRATEEGLAKLEAARAAQAAVRGDVPAFVEADIAFHTAIADMAGNPLVSAASQGMLTWMARFKLSLIAAPGAEELTLREHRAIHEAIAARDPEAAAKAMSDHLLRTDADYARLVREG